MRIKKGQQEFLLALYIFAPFRRRGGPGRTGFGYNIGGVARWGHTDPEAMRTAGEREPAPLPDTPPESPGPCG